MDDLSSLIGSFYAQAGTQNKNAGYTLGQVIYVPTLEIENRCWIADVQRVDSYAHDKVTLLIRKQKDNDFITARQQPPIKALELSDGHEII